MTRRSGAAGVRVGANGYLTKPFTPEQLHAAIAEALGWHEEHQQRGTTGEINFDIRSELTYLAQASDMLADLFAHTPLTERHIKDLKQAVMEMGGNAIEWGHRKNAELVLRITYRIDSDLGHPDHQGPGARLRSEGLAACGVRRRPDPAPGDPQRARAPRGRVRHHAGPRAGSTASGTTRAAIWSPWSSTSIRIDLPRRDRDSRYDSSRAF